jgi:hypothetical protein
MPARAAASRSNGTRDEADGGAWLQSRLDIGVAAVPGLPWILVVDVTLSPLQGTVQR